MKRATEEEIGDHCVTKTAVTSKHSTSRAAALQSRSNEGGILQRLRHWILLRKLENAKVATFGACQSGGSHSLEGSGKLECRDQGWNEGGLP